jgi:polyisoprenyl-phosphate glycosyltransferase
MNRGFSYSNIWSHNDITQAERLHGPILIVGASGFIGANLFFSLTKFRDDVLACSRTPRSSWRLAPVASSKLVSVDITQFERVRNMIQLHRPRTIFNISAYGGYARQTDADLIHRTNYLGTLNLLRAASEIGCDAFIHTGTSSEYGLNCVHPDEDGALLPNSDYAVSKVGANYLVQYYGSQLKFPCVNLRLYSIYGPWEDRDRLIANLISHCLDGRLPFFTSKEISRDFVYIDDCTRAMILAAHSACKTNPGLAINIATGIKTTIAEIAELARRHFRIKEKPVFGSMANRKWDLAEWYGDPGFAEKVLGWKYATSLAKGLGLTAVWEKEFQKRLKFVFIPKKEKKISAIIACYKDSRSIPILHERLTRVLQASGYGYEIIFVNDASPDDDEKTIYALTKNDTHVIGITHSRNFGSQSAFLSGLEIAGGDAAVFLDGDGQDPPEIIADFIRKWEEGYEIVYGQRIKREASFLMQIFYKLFYRVFAKLADVNIPLDAGDFSLIDRKVLNHLLKFTEKDVFIRGLRAWVGFRQIGVPYTRPERLFGRSTNNLAKNIWWAKKAIFSFSTKPLTFIQNLGVAIFVLSAALSAFYLIYYLIRPPQNAKGLTTVILLVLGLGSIQLISTSILGDYVSKIIEEVKNRPRFIRNKILYNGEIHISDDQVATIVEMFKNNRDISG